MNLPQTSDLFLPIAVLPLPAIPAQTDGMRTGKLEQQGDGTMTEKEWLESTDPQAMLAFLRGKASDRKLRLLACACCRRIWLQLGEATPEAVKMSERVADGEASKNEMRSALSRLGAMGGISAAWAANCAKHAVLKDEADIAAAQAVRDALFFAYHQVYEETFSLSTYTGDEKKAAEAERVERKKLIPLIREAFGNPFRPITLDSTWLGPKALTLAQQIYHDRAFDRLPALADTLQQAGCDDAEILAHLRGPGPHVLGCWALDLILGKD
jgi:hypothetical protein